MIVRCALVRLVARDSFSLKDKRSIVRGIIASVRHKYNVSIAEVDDQDLHQSIVIGVSVVSSSISHAQDVIDAVIRHIDNNENAEITDVSFEYA